VITLDNKFAIFAAAMLIAAVAADLAIRDASGTIAAGRFLIALLDRLAVWR
jgi:hypothetical protein